VSKLAAGDLMSLEQYARERPAFRAQVLRHKAERQLAVGPNSTWIFEPQGIQDELEAYNPLIPDGGNWKVTLLIEFAQPAERVRALARLRGIEDRCWVQVAGHERVFAIADEDLPRANEEKTSAVHFLRFELEPAMIASLRGGARLAAGIDHEHYRYVVHEVPAAMRIAVTADFA